LSTIKQTGAKRAVNRTGPTINRPNDDGRIGRYDVNPVRKRSMMASTNAARKTSPILAMVDSKYRRLLKAITRKKITVLVSAKKPGVLPAKTSVRHPSRNASNAPENGAEESPRLTTRIRTRSGLMGRWERTVVWRKRAASAAARYIKTVFIVEPLT
jgi:hypothetical protein